jgi:hypothetical protein
VQLSRAGIWHCLIEGDNLDMAYPPPWEHGLAERNLAAMWGTTDRRMDLGHFETAGGIEPTKIDERGWGAPTAPCGVGPGGVATTDIGGSATAMITATPVNLAPVDAQNPTSPRNLRGR